MSACKHNNCGGIEKVWLPYSYRGMEVGLKPHPYCTECGLVKSLSSEKPRNIGFYINIITALSKKHKIAQVQIRIMAQEMEKADFEEPYGMDRYIQEKLFIEMAKKYLNLPEKVLMECLSV